MAIWNLPPGPPNDDKLYVLGADEAPSVEGTVSRLVHRFPSIKSFNVERLVESTLAAATDVKGAGKGHAPPEYQWLFVLAGFLKASLPRAQQKDLSLGEQLTPFAHLFVEILKDDGKLRTDNKRIDWSDEDAVSLEFARAWEKRRFAEGAELLSSAVDFASANPLGIQGNRHLVRLLNVAFFLQKVQGSDPILLPVSPKLATLLETTPVTLGTAVAKAIQDGYISLGPESANYAGRRARSFFFNFDHPKLTNQPEVDIDRWLERTKNRRLST